MAMAAIKSSQLQSMSWEQGLDHYAKEILLKGFGRPWKLYAAHAAIIAANYGGFLACFRRDFLRLMFWGSDAGSSEEEKAKARQKRRSLAAMLFAKFLVWQHLAEALGCRQGPIGGHFGLPNNWKFRLSLGTIKHPLLPFLGKKRNVVDLFVHVLFFIFGFAFLRSKEYNYKAIRALCACDVWICLSDLSQFFASTGHAYFSMLLSACFPESRGQLAGIQMGLLIQWFFSGIGKFGPWFGYVNGPFMLQSKILGGQSWLFNLLVKSPTNLQPTLFGKVFAHTAAAVEYLAPVALMAPRPRGAARPSLPDPSKEESSALAASTGSSPEATQVAVYKKRDRLAKAFIWLGLTGIVGMHTYILTMPAPFDVYSWNMCFGFSALYLFYYASFGFDHGSAARMHPGLAAFLLAEFALCWYGQFYPDKIGYYISHRYWAGNWVQTFFYCKRTEAAWRKLGRVKSFSSEPQIWRSLEHHNYKTQMGNFAYNWLANLNMKAAVGLVMEGIRTVGGPAATLSDFFPLGLMQMCCGEFRDALYAVPVLPSIQEQIGFDSGECFMVRIGAFGMFRDTATWGIYDLKDGLIKSGLLRLSQLAQMDSYPSQSLGAFQ